MEPRRKLRVTSSSQVQGACCERIMFDRFSDLPDEIALRILNFVGQSLRSLIQLGAVSNRCRRLHLSAPSLTISSSCVSISSRLRTRLLNYWERYLFSRGDNKIENFRIFWKFDSKDGAMKRSDEFFRIATLIQNAVRCNVECLELTFTQNYLNTVVLPSCIFHCHSLMHLYVNLSGGVIQSPSSFPSYFQSLKLHDTKVSDDRFFKWISNSCKCIKDLHLFNVGGMESITIESSSLETFSCQLSADICKVRNLKIAGEKLEDVCIHWEFYSRGGPVLDRASSSRSLNIFAPKLKKLTWCGNFLNHQHLGNLTCLEYARIFLWPDLEKFSNLFEVLCSLCMVRTLLLGEHTIKAFLVEGSMPLPLCNIRDLTLEVNNLDHDCIQAVLYIFRGITTLNKLCIMSHLRRREVTYDETEGENNVTILSMICFSDTSEEDDTTEEEDSIFDLCDTDVDNCETSEEDDAYVEKNYEPIFDVEFWKSQNLSFTNELQEVILEIVEGNDNAMELARYILEHAQNLKKMVIHHSPQHPNVVEMVSKIKMISSATVILTERRLCPLRW